MYIIALYRDWARVQHEVEKVLNPASIGKGGEQADRSAYFLSAEVNLAEFIDNCRIAVIGREEPLERLLRLIRIRASSREIEAAYQTMADAFGDGWQRPSR